MLVEIGPWSLVDPEIVQAGLAERGSVVLELLVQRVVPAPQLLHEDIVDNARGFNQLREGVHA